MKKLFFIFCFAIKNHKKINIVCFTKNKLSIVTISNSALFISYLLFFFSACTNSNNTIDGIPLEITCTVTHVSNYRGSDGAITLDISGGTPPYSFQWSNGETTKNIQGVQAGLYTIVVVDADNQRKSVDIEVKQPLPDALSLTFRVLHVTTKDGNNGSIDLMVSGGVPPYKYNWSNGATTEDINNLTAGMYTVVVTDAIDSMITDSVKIMEPSSTSIVIQYEIAPPDAENTPNGSIDLQVTGGVPPYSYSWSTGSQAEDLTGIQAGDYTITVTDKNGQTASLDISVSGPIVTDADGNRYRCVKIGEQIWMLENMRTTKSAAGKGVESFCYADNEANEAIYGRLYTWDAAMNGSTLEKAQGICPDGWHIPTDNEWQTLEMQLGMTPDEAGMINTWRGAPVGKKLLQGGDSGFEAMLSGRRSSSGTYSLLNEFEYIWTSTEYGNYAWRRCLRADSDAVGRWNTFPKTYAFSVRCIKNQ